MRRLLRPATYLSFGLIGMGLSTHVHPEFTRFGGALLGLLAGYVLLDFLSSITIFGIGKDPRVIAVHDYVRRKQADDERFRLEDTMSSNGTPHPPLKQG